ncbi:A-kinase anchor protein 10, mitochondrial-like [Uloborus diversus]|uniref:A-kinase anchor protein 10, mitochondrial-like n=1 Tax=Uloborus diversus TaxID=327109 RepID=UPI002409D229|nr:A-kinase anchor protein 10, mitochondrial-like [Uloborus diversus]
MPLFRRKTESSLPKTSSISIYGQGRAQPLHRIKNSDKHSDSDSFSSIDLDDRPHPLAFAEATFESSLPMKTKSRLSKDLLEVLHDNAALAYFIQFMDANKAKHLVKFWLEAESFQVSSETKRWSLTVTSMSGQTNDDHLEYDSHSGALTVPSSASSDCASSEKSDEVFPSSSHSNYSSARPKSKRKGLNSVSTHDVVPVVPNSFNETSTKVSVSKNSVNNKQSSDIQQSSSIDSGCEVKSVQGSSVVLQETLDSVGDCATENRLNVNNLSKPSCQESFDASSDVDCGKEQDTEILKDGLGKLETSTEQDAKAIYYKYIAQDAPSPIGVNDELRSMIQDEIFRPSGDIEPHCFVLAQEFVVKRMDKEFFPNFLRSSFHCKHQIDVLTSGTVFLADVLYNDSALFFFMEFMEQEGVRHLVDFLLMAHNFQKHLLSLKEYDGLQAQTDAMILYEKYFSLQATTPLGFSDEVRCEVETNICREGGPLPDCFVKPVKILMQYLEKTYLLQFLNSQLYFKYISECIIIIQNGVTDVPVQQKYPGSDSGSEQSLPISTVNTLLAMDSKQPGASKIIKNIDDQDLRIDTIQFKPDALWQRPLAGRLQMAHVDHLGRVTTEFEPEPDKRRESRISKAVKKLVNWEEDKNQEDMAWKVAEMIVKDICSVTMPDEPSLAVEKSPSHSHS